VTASGFTEWVGVSEAQKLLLADAQTSGGLLLCVPPHRLEAVRALLLRRRALCVAVIGRMVRSAKPRIQVSL
jgi:selenide,water dikinase